MLVNLERRHFNPNIMKVYRVQAENFNKKRMLSIDYILQLIQPKDVHTDLNHVFYSMAYSYVSIVSGNLKRYINSRNMSNDRNNVKPSCR
jgi:hypothetical protein